MASVKLLALFIMASSFAKIELKPLISKQIPGRMRYISDDGKVSFYQKRNGALAFSTNFNVSEILSGPSQTYYFVISGSENKTFLLIKDEFFLTSNSIRNTPSIYAFHLKDKSPRYWGKGISPKLHLLETWGSYYNPHQKKIYIKSLINSILDFNLNINSTKDPFFIPEVLVLDNNRILFTDVNKTGHITLLLFTRSTKKIDVFYRPKLPGKRIELCTLKDRLYLGEFPLNGMNNGSQITEINLETSLDYSKGRIIYESPYSDYGSLICFPQTNKLYFIKVFYQGKNHYEYFSEAVELDSANKKIKKISEERHVTQLIQMDGRILVPHRGKFLIAKGDTLKNDSLD